MNDEELIQKLEEFEEFLNVGTVFSDAMRQIGWLFMKGLAFIVDGLESVADQVLLLKTFFNNPEIVTFVDTIRPFLYILLAFSLLWTGYMLVFQKKIDRDGIAINIFIALTVVILLSTGMNKANDFTDDAVRAINTAELYHNGSGSISDNVISLNITDLVEFDKQGWSNTDIDPTNTIPLSLVSNIKITEKFDSDRSELDMSSDSKDISKKYLLWTASKKDVTKFDQGGLEWNNEYYYRYDVNWLTLLVTLCVMAFTLFSIAYKLARLTFELTFNYILALVVAPADVHDGQKTKKILESIFNTFLVIILIFLSMKVYIIGTAYIADQLEGMAYLIALTGFSVAVVDGPNIVERLFGIDAGLKNGWSLLAGAYAGTKAITGLGKGLSDMVKGSNEGKANGTQKTNPDKPKSPNDEDANGENGNPAKSKDTKNGSVNGEGQNVESGESSKEKSNTTGISGQLDQQEEQGKKQTKAPSPNDHERQSISQQDASQESANAAGISEQQQGNANVSEAQTGSASGPTATGGGPNVSSPSQQTTGGSQSQQTANVEQRSTSQVDTDVANISEQQQGNANVSEAQTGSASAPLTTGNGPNAPSPSQQTTGGSQSQQTANVEQRSTSQVDTDVANISEQQQGNANVSEAQTGSASAPLTTGNGPNAPSPSQQTTGGTQERQTANVEQRSTSQVDTDIANISEQQQGNANVSEAQTGSASASLTTGNGPNAPSPSPQTTGGTQERQTANVEQRSTSQVDTNVSNISEQQQGNVNVSEAQTGSASAPTATGSGFSVPSLSPQTTGGTQERQTVNVEQRSTSQVDTEITNSIDEVAVTTVHQSDTSTGQENSQVSIGSQNNSRIRPSKYSTNKNSVLKNMKVFNRKTKK